MDARALAGEVTKALTDDDAPPIAVSRLQTALRNWFEDRDDNEGLAALATLRSSPGDGEARELLAERVRLAALEDSAGAARIESALIRVTIESTDSFEFVDGDQDATDDDWPAPAETPSVGDRDGVRYENPDQDGSFGRHRRPAPYRLENPDDGH